jgi:hypothetical protein
VLSAYDGCVRATRRSSFAFGALMLVLCGCGDASDAANGEPPPLDVQDGGPSANGAAAASAGPGDGSSAGSMLGDASAPDAHADAGPSCAKHLTVVFSVGVGAAGLATHSNGCWTVVDADGAANHKFRKCSTSNFQVGNPLADNYSYDDTNPTRPLSQDQSFLTQCAASTTGDGFEFMAYRGSWRMLGAPNLRAYFAELYGDATNDVDSLLSSSGVYNGNAQLAAHNNVYPMINIGPPATAHLENHIGATTLALCKKIADHGYFGTYVATWPAGLAANDPRTMAVANALDKCTAM